MTSGSLPIPALQRSVCPHRIHAFCPGYNHLSLFWREILVVQNLSDNSVVHNQNTMELLPNIYRWGRNLLTDSNRFTYAVKLLLQDVHTVIVTCLRKDCKLQSHGNVSSDLLKVDYIAQSKLNKKMSQKYPKIHIKGVKTCQKHVKMVKMHDFFSFGVHI